MTFPFSLQIAALLWLCLLLGSGGCARRITPEQRAVRAELRQTLRERSYQRAAELAVIVVGSAPRENGGWEKLVRAQLGLQDYAAAKQTLEEWRSIIPRSSPKFHELAGDIAKKQQDPLLALESWSKALAKRPQNTRVLRKVARLHHSLGRWQDENQALTALLEIEEDATERMNRALARRRLHRWSEAMEDKARAVEVAPNDPDVRRGAKLFERIAKFLGEIREVDARIAVLPNDDQLLTDRALLFLRSADPDLALEDGLAAAKLAPWAIRPRLAQAIALIALDRAAEAAELGIMAHLRLDSLTTEFLDAISRLDGDIALDQNNADLYAARAWQLNDIGQPRLALAEAERGQVADEKSAAAAAERGYALAKLGRQDEAFEQVKRATELDPKLASAWQYRGEMEMSRGDHDAAIQSLTLALEISQTPLALQKREECYRQLGLFAKADEDLKALSELTPR